MTETVKPTGITVDRTRQVLRVSWSDDHTSDYPWAGLRAACPCVHCRGGHAAMGAPPDPGIIHLSPPLPEDAIRLRQVQLAGNYALQVEWDDGHAYGLYQWAYLRDLCPCPKCTRQLPDRSG